MKKVDLLLINPPFHTRNGGGSFFPLGLGYIISSVLAHEYTWDVIDCTQMIHSFYPEDLAEFRRELKNRLQEYDPLMIGVGPCITSQLRALKIIAICCKEAFPNVPVVAGGPLASIEGQEWLFYEELGIKYIIKGDGEDAIPSAINAIKCSGNIESSPMISRPGYNHLNRIDDLDSILFPYRERPERDTFSVRRAPKDGLQKRCAMITSRGCPYACNYCVSGNLSQKVRKRSAENIISEMAFLHHTHGIDDVIFYDDCFFSNIKLINKEVQIFCDLLGSKDLKVTWQIELRPDLVLALTQQSITLLDASGCRQINVGIEKVSKAGLNFLGKTSKIEGLREKFLEIKQISKIKLSATFILGGGTETREDVLDLISEATTLGLDYAHFNPLFLYPGTPLYRDMVNDDRMWAKKIYDDILPWGEIVYENSSLRQDDLLELVDYAYTEFYKGTDLAEQEMIRDRFNIKHGGKDIEDV